MEQKLTIARVETADCHAQLQAEWAALLSQSTRPSIYASFDYIDTSIRHFLDEEVIDIFYLTMRDDQQGQLRAIFPMSVGVRKCFNRQVRVLEHAITTHNSDVDKPYPIIHRDYESDCWHQFKEYFCQRYTEWDWLEYTELIAQSQLNQLVKRLFPLPRFLARQLPGPQSPIVDLQQPWQVYWRKHRNLRKKYRRIQQRFGDNYRYQIYQNENEMQQCLQCYIAIEKLGWKNNIGLSEPLGENFYRELLPRLAKDNRAFFGILYDGDTAVSVELSFVYGSTVYFAHGTFNPAYAKLSPGSVSTSKFIEYFCDQQYQDGDFLAGFAHYINDWAGAFVETKDTVVYKLNMIFFYYAARRLWNSIKKRFKRVIKK